jgi:putative hemolysin
MVNGETGMPLLEIALIFVLVLINGLMVMSELAIVSSKKVHLRRMADEGYKGADKALALAEDTGKFLPTVQVGITLTSILTGAVSGAALADNVAAWLARFGLALHTAEALAVVFIVMAVTYISIVIGELAPKELALRHPEKLAAALAPLIDRLSRMAWPAVWLLNRSCAVVLKLVGARDKAASTVTQEEVKALIVEGTNHGVFARKERDMLSGVMLLADKPVRAFMIPRVDVVSLDSNATADEVRAVLMKHGYSRFPVNRRGDEDHVLGIVQTKDILAGLMADEPLRLKPLIKEVSVFPDGTSAIKVIEALRHTPTHVAIVVNEHGAFEGIVTLVDLMAVITGEFYEPGQQSEITERPDGSWLINGGILIDRAFAHIGLPGKAESRNFHTLAGFILHQTHAVPRVGDTHDYKGFRFEVVDMDGYRIDKLLVRRLPEAEAARRG